MSLFLPFHFPYQKSFNYQDWYVTTAQYSFDNFGVSIISLNTNCLGEGRFGQVAEAENPRGLR